MYKSGENLGRPSWDEYYLTIAYVVAQRSFDPSSKCGTVLVSNDNRVLATGYNGPLKGSVDSKIPLTRPEKYCHMLHGEENALLAYSGSYQDIQGSTAYVTGRPCHRCLRMMLQKGITRIVYSSANVTKVVDQDDMDAQEIMIYGEAKTNPGPDYRHPRVDMVEMGADEIFELLNTTKEYIERKLTEEKNY
jgi:dCMP deaminase